MNVQTMFGAALMLALMISLLPALEPIRKLLRDARNWTPPGLIPGEAGVVVVTYCNPIQGAPTVTAPTAAQAAQIPEQQAQIFWADGDSQAVFQHNWGLPNSFPTWLWPQVIFEKSLGSSTDTFRPLFTFGLTNTNSVTINKMSTIVGSGGTYNVYLRRPHSLAG
jgi:hypothetical protein